FSKIHINFLIVGHTHASIDQFFSTLSKAINGCNFIGTPQALMHLFMTKRSRSKLTEDFKIGLSKQIQVYYDYVKLFAPYTNTLIHGYQIPHNFKIERQFHAKACMQYRLFVSDPCWLPVAPLRDKGGGDEGEDILANNPVDLVELSLTFGITGGPECLKEHLDVGGDSATHFLQNDATANKMRDLRAMHNDLMRVNEESTNQQYQRMADEVQPEPFNPQGVIDRMDDVKAAISAKAK
ncbi:hypothetical protein B484DRAFT_411482, partial [Ochromonadaceae sp. CCMP2298]